MADKENNFRTVNIFWSKEDSVHGDEALVPARGNMESPGNQRPKKNSKNVKGKKTVEVAATIPSRKKQQLVQNIHPPAAAQNLETKEVKKASLKDLCLEDKQRIANLIKELARLGEEKETTIQTFNEERSKFEQQVRELLTQQDQILTDRETIQSQLHECQDMLVKYQRLVDEQKHKLAQSAIETKKTVQFDLSNTTPKRNLERSFISQKNTGVQTMLQINELSQHEISASPLRTNQQARHQPQPAQILQQRQATQRANQSKFQDQVQAEDPFAERPFTNMIDGLIAEERNRSKTTDDRELKLGPLANPQFESTHVNNTADFQPLMPDRTTQLSELNSNQDDSSSATDSNVLGPEFLKPKSVSTPAKKNQTALIPEGLSDDEFMDYYKKLTPTDRKKQLFVQKQALIEEQERLKKILAQQEAMLEKKHIELRKQQDIQKERLNYFERTGTFPNHYQGYQERVPDPFGLPNTNNVNAPSLGYPNGAEFPYSRQPFMPIPPPQTLHPAYYGHLPPSYPGPVYGVPPPPGYPTGQHYPGFAGDAPPRQPPGLRDYETVSESTKESRSATTMSSSLPDSARHMPSSNHGPQYRNHKQPASNRNHRLYSNKPLLGDLRDDRAADLLQIVSEVESLHNRSTDSAPTEALSPYLVPSGRQKPISGENPRDSIPFSGYSSGSDIQTAESYGDGNVSTESLEDLEESRVLEDVFFIK